MLLIAGRRRREGALLINLLLIGFLIGILSAMARGLDIECGCFGGVDEKVGWPVAIRDLIMLAAGVVLVVIPEKRVRISQDRNGTTR